MQGAYHPRTDVSFSPTRTFGEVYPSELEEQRAKFTQPTWVGRMEQPKEEENRVAKPIVSNWVASPALTAGLKEQVETNPLLSPEEEEQIRPRRSLPAHFSADGEMAKYLLAGGIFLGAGILIWKYWGASTVETIPPP